MVRYREFGVSVAAVVLSFGVFSSVTAAETLLNVNRQYEQHEKVPIQVASTETVVLKNELIKKLKELFPNKFDFLTNGDFYMDSSHDTIGYDLSFHKKIKGKSFDGRIRFVGTNLEIQNFFYISPLDESYALFPAKVSKDEAKRIAQEFVEKLTGGKNYTLVDSNRPSQTLLDPIRYSFAFLRTENGINIPDQRIDITILGSGEVEQFFQNTMSEKSSTFDELSKIKAESEIVKKIKENLSVNLQYQINYDHLTRKQKAELVYNSSIQFREINALTGEWELSNGFSNTLQKNKKIEMITETALKPKHKGVTLDEAKKMVEQLFKIDSEEVKLTINNIGTSNRLGNEIISIQYSYEYENGSPGTVLEIDKKTGEFTSYYNLKNEILSQIGEQPKSQIKLTEQQVLTKAIEYLKESMPSKLHNYAKPITEPYYDSVYNTINFRFPRVVNGIIVSGDVDMLSVSINEDGSLNSLSSHYHPIENWPAVEQAISVEEAKNSFIESLSLSLNYIKLENNLDDKHYYLVYTPRFNENLFSLNAITGEWNKSVNEEQTNELSISHPLAEKELNYLIQNNILQLNDIEQFSGDSSLTKGEVLQVLVKSLTNLYEGSYPEQQNITQSYKNIGPEHPQYNVVERAVAMGILDTETQEFNTYSRITREQLAVWYVRALGLEKLAKYYDLSKLDMKDRDKVSPQYVGYVAIAGQLGLLPNEKDNFNPKREVTYAELALSIVRLAHEINESGSNSSWKWKW